MQLHGFDWIVGLCSGYAIKTDASHSQRSANATPVRRTFVHSM